jgi:hypothetical protein
MAFMLSVASSLFAGYSNTTRNKCHWWANRYVSTGHISTFHCGWQYSYSHSGNCGGSSIHFDRNWCCGTNATVDAANNSGGQSGYFYPACSMNGQSYSDLLLELGPNDGDPGSDEPNYQPGTQATTSNPSFAQNGENTVTISGISVRMSSDINDPNINTYTLAVWVPADDSTNGEDTVYAASKAIAAGTVSIDNGHFSVTGRVFSADDFSVSNDGRIVSLNYVGGDKTISLNASTNIADVAVTGFGDIGVNQQARFSQATANNNGIVTGQLDFNAFPNPTTNALNLSFKSAEATSVSVSVYDATGKLVMQKNDVSINIGMTNSTLNFSTLANGQYFVMAEGKGIKVIKKVTKQ